MVFSMIRTRSSASPLFERPLLSRERRSDLNLPMTDLEVGFRGKTAVITGAASGIGAGLARHAAKLGMNLVLADINSGQLEQVAETLTSPVVTVPTDVTDLA